MLLPFETLDTNLYFRSIVTFNTKPINLPISMTNYYTIIIRIIYYISRIQRNIAGIAPSLFLRFHFLLKSQSQNFFCKRCKRLHAKSSFGSGLRAVSLCSNGETATKRVTEGRGARKTWRGAREKRRVIHPCGNIAREHTWPELQLQLQPPVTDRG